MCGGLRHRRTYDRRHEREQVLMRGRTRRPGRARHQHILYSCVPRQRQPDLRRAVATYHPGERGLVRRVFGLEWWFLVLWHVVAIYKAAKVNLSRYGYCILLCRVQSGIVTWTEKKGNVIGNTIAGIVYKHEERVKPRIQL